MYACMHACCYVMAATVKGGKRKLGEGLLKKRITDWYSETWVTKHYVKLVVDEMDADFPDEVFENPQAFAYRVAKWRKKWLRGK